jgi:hypothetical protein
MPPAMPGMRGVWLLQRYDFVKNYCQSISVARGVAGFCVFFVTEILEARCGARLSGVSALRIRLA